MHYSPAPGVETQISMVFIIKTSAIHIYNYCQGKLTRHSSVLSQKRLLPGTQYLIMPRRAVIILISGLIGASFCSPTIVLFFNLLVKYPTCHSIFFPLSHRRPAEKLTALYFIHKHIWFLQRQVLLNLKRKQGWETN